MLYLGKYVRWKVGVKRKVVGCCEYKFSQCAGLNNLAISILDEIFEILEYSKRATVTGTNMSPKNFYHNEMPCFESTYLSSVILSLQLSVYRRTFVEKTGDKM